MIPQLSMKHTLESYSARLGLLDDERKQAAVRALNRTMGQGKTQAARELAAEYPGLKISQLKARLKVQRATRSNPVAALTFSGRRISLFGNFGMRGQGKFGVRFGRLPWRLETISGDQVTPEMLQRAFRNRGPGGRASVFARHTQIRLSQEVLVVPGVARAFAERKVGEVIARLLRTRFPVVFVQEAKFRLSKR